MCFRVIFFITGVLVSFLALTMLLPLCLEMVDGHPIQPFLTALCITGFLGIAFALANRPRGKINLGKREAFITTTIIWFTLSVFAGLPFYCASQGLSFLDACFEAVSALTTTGATIFPVIESLPRGVLLWRSLLQWLGGLGIVVMAMTVFPILRIGGMQLFRSEFSDKSEKILPRVSQIASAILLIYIFFTLICTFSLLLAGLSWFDALCHAMTAISTGGLSTKNGSIGAFHNPMVEIILCIFMFVGGSALVLYVRLLNKDWTVFKNSQLHAYAGITVVCITLMTGWHYISQQGTSFLYSLRHSAFITISFITSTGYFLEDYTTWGSFGVLLLFLLSFLGGCTGSTTGGIKIFRFQILYNICKTYLHQLRKPHGVYIPLYDSMRITEVVAFSVFSFIVLYFLSIVIISLLLCFFGLDFLSGLSGAVACLGNVGPGVSKLVAFDAHVGGLPILAKIVMMFSMLLGRVELLTIIVLLMPSFWRH